MNLYASIDAVAADRGSAPAWVVPGRGTWTYQDLRSGAARFAAALRERGVVAGDRVLMQVEKSPEALLLYLACLRSGAVLVPLNTAYTAAEVAHFVADAMPRLIVADPARRAALEGIAAVHDGMRVTTLDGGGGGEFSAQAGASANEAAARVEPRNDDDLAAIVYTSGTTGRSKGAMLSHRNLRANAEALVRLWAFTAEDRLLHALPIYHVHGLFVATHCALLSGASCWLLPRFDVDTALQYLPQSTTFMGVPTYYTRLLADPRFGREQVHHLRLLICGSAPLLVPTFEAFFQRTGHRILERYGMSEAGMITSNPLAGQRIAGSVGFPLPGVSARVADETGCEVARGTAGVLEIRGPNVFCGYWRQSERSATEFRADGFFITGDVAIMDESGRVSIVGRVKDLIISGGFNIYPKEIELEIDALEGVAESAVVGVPHPDFGEAVIAVVVTTRADGPSEADILAALAPRLARFKQPKRVIFVAELPRNPMGKVQKSRLREMHASAFQSPTRGRPSHEV